MVKNKRSLREKQKNDPFANAKGTGPIRNKPGTKPMRKAKKFAEEMSRKSERMAANKHMKENGG